LAIFVGAIQTPGECGFGGEDLFKATSKSNSDGAVAPSDLGDGVSGGSLAV
jgi:hypothetical protein